MEVITSPKFSSQQAEYEYCLKMGQDLAHDELPFASFRPWSKQLEVLQATQYWRLLAWANRCLGGETPIYDPVIGKEIPIAEIDDDFHVLAFDGIGFVVAVANKPFVKGPIEPIYEIVLSSGHKFTASAQHRILTPSGWLAIASLRLGSAVFLPQSSLEFDPLIHSVNAQSFLSITQDFQCGCRSLSRFCDAQPHREEDNDQSHFPSQFDVREHIFRHDHQLLPDDPACKLKHNHSCLCSCHHSIQDGRDRNVVRCVGCEYYSPYTACQLLNVHTQTCQQQTSVFSFQPRLNDESVQLDNSLDGSLVKCSYTIVQSIKHIRNDVKYDCTIPIYNNYYSCGAIHHNTGKTTVGSCECVMAGMGMHGYIDYPDPPITIWASSVDYKQMRDSIMAAFEGDGTHPRMLPKGVYLHKETMSYTLPHPCRYNPIHGQRIGDEKRPGSVIRLKSCDNGRESFQGGAIPLHWWDEELPEDIIKEMILRLPPGYVPRIIWTMTAVRGLNWGYDHIYVPWKDAADHGIIHPDIYYSEASMYEAPHITDEQIRIVLSAYPPGSKEAKIRVKGGFVDMAGDSYFSEDAYQWHRANCRDPIRTIKLSWDGSELKETVITDLSGEEWVINLFCESYKTHSYSIGSDVMEGKLSNPNDPESPRDWSTIIVVDRITGETAATVHTRTDPTTVGKIIWMLGKYFNGAWLTPEINSHGIAALGALLGRADPIFKTYPNIYRRRTGYDERVDIAVEDDLGWRTTEITRPLLIQGLRDSIDFKDGQKPSIRIYDKKIVDEMMAFQRDKNGKIQHVRGRHDDALFGLGIAIQVHMACPLHSLTGVASGTPGVGKVELYEGKSLANQVSKGSKIWQLNNRKVIW